MLKLLMTSLEADRANDTREAPKDKIYKVHANVLWQPVKQMRMGWEVIWARSHFEDGEEEDGVRATFGTWFFF